MPKFIDCSTFITEPCVSVELINCDCERYALDNFVTAFFAPRLNLLGDFRLRFFEGDIPEEFLNCCTKIKVTIDWDEVGLNNFVAFSGRFTSSAGYVGDRELEVIEWRGTSLNSAVAGNYIAYRSTTAGSQKSGLTAIEAAYEYLVENLQTPLADRGDGTLCATDPLLCYEVIAPTAEQVANSSPWSGGRSYKNLLDTVAKIAKLDGFYIDVTFRESDCCHIVELKTPVDMSDVLLSECLENVYVQSVFRSCTNVDRVHALGAGVGAARLIETVCLDSGTCCGIEEIVEDDEETDPLALQILAQERIEELNTKERVLFDAQWGCSFIPFRDVWLGDIVELDFDDNLRQFRLDELSFQVSSSDDGIVLVEARPFFEEV